jgi:hypothetical protein
LSNLRVIPACLLPAYKYWLRVGTAVSWGWWSVLNYYISIGKWDTRRTIAMPAHVEALVLLMISTDF